jgi:glycosyltransferase involved in cell wall biosynthesis
VVTPGDGQLFVAEAKRLVDNPELRRTMGDAGRRYAEATFDIVAIGDKFEGVLSSAVQPSAALEPATA